MKSRIALLVMLACAGTGTLWAQSTPSLALLVLLKRESALAIVDPATLKVVGRVPAGPNPHEVAASPDGKTAYMSNYGAGAYNTISVADLVTQRSLPAIDLGVLHGPHGLWFAGGELYFTAESNKAIGRYDPATGKIDWIMGTGQDRTHMIMVADNLDRIFTSNVASATISIFDQVARPMRPSGPPPGAPNGPPTPLPGMNGPPPGPRGLDWKQTIIPVGRGSEGFDVTPDGKELWVANADDGTISIIDIAQEKVIQTLEDNFPDANRLKFTIDGKRAFVSGFNAEGLAVFDVTTRKEIKRIKLGRGSAGILMQPDGSRVYVACSPDNYVAVVDLKSLEVVGRIDAGQEPDGLAWAARR
jgi:YVTN family beta-propeller protein